jgi:hypothetical protein
MRNVTYPTEFPPDELQMKASADAAEVHHSDDLRGHFLPWGLLELPIFGRAFRFVYPTLLVVAENRAFLYDIPTMRHTTIVDDIQTQVDGSILGRINYVELTDRYVVICGSQQLRVFSNSRQPTLLYHISASKSFYAKVALDLAEGHENDNPDLVLIPRATSAHINDVSATPEPLPPALVDVMRFDDFVAGTYGHVVRRSVLIILPAHITPSGLALVALLSFGRVVIVGNFDRVVNGEMPLADAALELNLHCSPLAPSLFSLLQYSTYLAVEEGRIAVATASQFGCNTVLWLPLLIMHHAISAVEST